MGDCEEIFPRSLRNGAEPLTMVFKMVTWFQLVGRGRGDITICKKPPTTLFALAFVGLHGRPAILFYMLSEA